MEIQGNGLEFGLDQVPVLDQASILLSVDQVDIVALLLGICWKGKFQEIAKTSLLFWHYLSRKNY